MKKILCSCSCVALLGCEPVVGTFIVPESDTPSSPSNTDVDTDEDTGPAKDSDSEPVTISSGTWSLAGAELIADDCGLMTVVKDYIDEPVTFERFLPNTFDVYATANGFDIKALYFGARGYIQCTVIEQRFTCTNQTVDGKQVAGGWPTAWVYEIAFSGTLETAQTLTGDATVRFPYVNPGDDYNLQIFGFNRPINCPQSYRLRLEASQP